MLAGVFKPEDFKEALGKSIIGTATGMLTNLGSSSLERHSGVDHNYHLEKMLATAYLESLEAVEREIRSGDDEELKDRAAEVIPALNRRLKRGLRETDLSPLFPLNSGQQPAATAFANRFSAEEVSLLVADEERWRARLGDEVEIALRRWLGEERMAEGSAGLTQLGLSPDAPLPEPLRKHLRTELPHRIAHRISELVKRDDFKESWIAFQRAHLQGMLTVLGRIEDSQADIQQSVDALSRRIEGFANQDELVAALGGKLEEFLRESHLPPDELARLLERQSAELRGLEERLTRKIEEEGEKTRETTRREAARVIAEVGKIQRPADNAPPRQLPAPPLDFTGREDELTKLRARVKSGSVTISGLHGMGGVGKTALALKLADELKDDYPDGQIYLDLKGVGRRSEAGVRQEPLTPTEVMSHVIRAWHPEEKLPDNKAELEARYRTVLADKRVLLLFDNARGAAQLTPLIPANRHCLLLVTSRQRFALGGREPYDIDKLKPQGAVDLLRLNSSRLGEEEAKEIAEICDYLPMALKPAVSLLGKSRGLTPEQLIRKLRDKKQLLNLKDAERKDELLNISIEASFELSYELMAEDEIADLQRRWRTLAVFPDTLNAAAAAAVWELDEGAARDALNALDSYSLIEIASAADTKATRYGLHDLARDYADTRLSATERELAGLLHSAHYLQILSASGELYEKGGEAIAEGLSLFDNERINIEAGQKWAASRVAADERAAKLCNRYPGIGSFVLSLRQHPRDNIHWLEAALSAAQQLEERADEGVHLSNLGSAYGILGEYRQAVRLHEQRLAIAREIGDQRGEGSALGNLGNAYVYLGETHRAVKFYEQALAALRALGDRRSEGALLGNLGLDYAELGDARRAIEFYEQNLALAREIGDRRSEAAVLGNLGISYKNLGEVHRAIDFHEQNLAVAREIGDRRSEGSALGNLGASYAVLGETQLAVGFYEQQLVITRESGDRRGEGIALANLGMAYQNLEETGEARRFLEAALKIFEEIESPHRDVVRGWLQNLRGDVE